MTIPTKRSHLSDVHCDNRTDEQSQLDKVRLNDSKSSLPMHLVDMHTGSIRRFETLITAREQL